MSSLCFSVVLSLILLPPLSSATYQKLSGGSSLSVENPSDILVSPNGTFSAGFFPVGDNAYAFAIWFSKPTCVVHNCTVVWMANRDQPVNGRRSKLSLLGTGNVILTDAAQLNVWATDTASLSPVQLQVNDYGNLLLSNSQGTILWQSFDSPTDTLLPLQSLTRYTALVSKRRKANYSSGFFKLFFDDDNVLRLLFDGPDISSVYWPGSWLVSWEAGRSTYNSSRNAMIDSLGNFSSSDDLIFRSADYGASWIQRRLTIDVDGNLRLYSREERDETWVVSWQAISQPCTIHGLCGENSLCGYAPSTGRKCSCPEGYKVKNQTDWSYGCKPEFDVSVNASEFSFIHLRNAEFYGYDISSFNNKTLKECEAICLQTVNCKGFQYKFNGNGFYSCFPKGQLRNGQQTPGFDGDIYIKLPKAYISYNNKKPFKAISLDCPRNDTIMLERSYAKSLENGIVKFMLWFASALGGVEIISIILVWWLTSASQEKNIVAQQGYLLAAAGFKRFTYDELKEATQNFNEEIGRGGVGTVYKGMLPDGRVAAVKRLNEANQGEAEFLAEVNTIGKLNHMNLIEMWGFCAEKKHRLLVYEYMEHGSLAENLSSHELDWQKRYAIALGTAKGLAYLHDECLEWVLHCDVKPPNILLDSGYQPKVSDFGLSKLLDRGKLYNSSFSKIRGTRGYMAPEWVFNRPITSKVDVYSYGIVVLEMVTGLSPTKGIQFVHSIAEREMEYRSVNWVKEKKKESNSMESWITEIVDPMLEGNYDDQKMETLVEVALHCVQEDRDARPTMSQVVERLLHHRENEN
ncbi:PREDICTED: putative receptor protein kinase ZmPK1 [Theobroma cacao]|uniref:Receptor-like serine/threonine-protein kinase n=1 Tax=Theobroma cacao TaxID=3641 RepID=A0AB32UVJ4_THECC|nr:PREDICTED: putative receptor protein kinase ZmPK1 [Theobroma cacao]